MVKLDIVRAGNTKLVQQQPIVAVFVGATSGIGEYTLQALAATHGTSGRGLRVYLVGRNAAEAERIFAGCRKDCPAGQYVFVKATDLSLLKDVDRCCAEISRLEHKEWTANNGPARVDILVMTHAILHLGPRMETEEGLDTSMSLLYYSRMCFIVKLLPLLRASPVPAHVISVYAGGMEKSGKLFPNDLSLRDPAHFSFANVRAHVIHMKAMFFERLAQQNPGRLSLAHIYPSLVVTQGFYSKSHPLWFKVAWRVLGPFVKRFVAVPAKETGDRMLFLASSKYPAREVGDDKVAAGTDSSSPVAMATDGVLGGGAYSVNYDNEVNATEKSYRQLRTKGFSDEVWNHTMKAFKEIEARTVFVG